MPFRDDDDTQSVLGLVPGFDINPEITSDRDLGTAALERESPLVSGFNRFKPDPNTPFDPSYRPWEDIQGTVYEQFSDRFVEIRNSQQAEALKAQLDREVENEKALDAAGPMGYLAEMGAALLSPTTLIPGGALVKNVRGGVRIGRSALSVGGSAGFAAALDEAALQSFQETRTLAESGYSIGGSVILGGLLGTGAASLSRAEFSRSASAAEQIPEAITGFNEHMQSINAATNSRDLTLRREALFQYVNKVPVLRGLVRSDPILRAQLSDNIAVRQTLADLVETPLQYAANEKGQITSEFGMSAEGAIKARRNDELTEVISHGSRQYAEYVNDGDVGTIGRLTAPLKGRWGHLAGYDRKMNQGEFWDEVGKALMTEDQHPIPQIEKTAQQIRASIFERVKDDAIDVGMFDEALQLKFGKSYFHRSYNAEKIAQHLRDGSEDDMAVLLEAEFKRKRSEAEQRLFNDRTLDKLEANRFQANERARGAQRALDKATKKAEAKKTRAEAAVSREKGVKRATTGLRGQFRKRMAALNKGVLQGDELDAFKDSLREARSAAKLEPQDMLSAIRELGGVRDDGTGELQSALDTSLHTIKRSDGMHADDMRGALAELGYLDEGTTEADFYNALREAATGNKIYSSFDGAEVARFEAAQEFIAALQEMGVDVSEPLDQIIKKLPGMVRNQKTQKAKAKEAGRSADKAGASSASAEQRLMKAMDRLDEAEARLRELDQDIGPKVREEIKAAREELKKLIPEIKQAKAAREADEFYAGLDDLEVTSAVDDAINSILGLKPGEHSYKAALSSPTRARVLDVMDEKLWPWLELNAEKVLAQYFNSIVPDIELTRRFGDLDMTEAKRRIIDEKDRLVRNSKSEKERTKHLREAELRIKELQNMADRIRGVYGVPDDPKDVWVRALRGTRTLSYMGYLGGMTLSALPDVAGVVGRNGIEAAFGSLEAVTNPKRFGMAAKDVAEIASGAEWFLNSRAVSMFEVMDRYGENTGFERGLAATSSAFSVATGMVPWNFAWKSIGGAFVSSKISKAAVASAKGKASKKDMLKLSENGIDSAMARRIAEQIEKHADRDGLLWLPQAKNWTDRDAFEAFRAAMNREMDIMIVTPGQDKPIAWSSEVGKFFSQFKSFAVSAHHRILLSGIQRADGAVLSQVLMAVTLGMMVSRIKAYQGGYEQKEGAALWEDAIDRSGLTGWLLEAHGLGNGLAGGRLSLSGELTSRFQSRSAAMGVLGPSVDMALGVYEGGAAAARGKLTERDARKLMRPIPGNNLPYLMGLTKQVAAAVSN